MDINLLFLAGKDEKRNGWCVFLKLDDIQMRYHAGPFREQADAESEAKRLNELKQKK